LHLDTQAIEGAYSRVAGAQSNSINLALVLELFRKSVPPHGPPGIIVEDDIGLVLTMRWAMAVYPHQGADRISQMLIDILAQLSGEALEMARSLRFESSRRRRHKVNSGSVGREVHVVRSHRSR
jgi:hypothetical protein